jgi:hypothetical protein
MTVHVGQITSEVRSEAPTHTEASSEDETSVWEERVRVSSSLERVARDRARTATGCSDD